jgi:phage tail sheath protein FI
MPPLLNFPGVYIEEIPSAVHTITGVATSIAAFAGWAAKGPTDEAVLVLSFSDFQNQFGGIDSRSYLGYAVNQFFANGGQQAYIIRVIWDGSHTALPTTNPKVAATSHATVGGKLPLFARNPGVWGDALRITVTISTTDPTRFSIQVAQSVNSNNIVLETFVNLSASVTDPRYALTVIDHDSRYITFVDPANGTAPDLTGTPSAANATALANGADGSPLAPKDGVSAVADGNFELALGADPATAKANSGIPLLDRVDIFNLLCVPGETDGPTISNLQAYCAGKRAFYIVDCPQNATVSNFNTNGPVGSTTGSLTSTHSENSAFYFPWVQAPDPAFGNRIGLFPPCGFVAGIYAATDANRGVWKAPAGIDAGLTGAAGLQLVLTDAENGVLNVKAINCLRQFKVYGDVVWGARTLQGADQAGSEWKYVPIRRLALFLESSLYDGTQWVVFEPNDEALWGQIRLNVGAFMQNLFLQGAFQGTTPQQAFFVKCDAENNPQASIDLGVVNILVGFAPLFPAEFVVIQIQQLAGQI